ncbi:MAG: acetyl-CoA C-acetyltransferase [Chitinophagales bacterium]|nr:acetyl-CoA C-acetyltransferase [Chitinophagales bacterium]MDW8419872.1 acetyl-CoA C-acetyltransferase [Chitinophagales bacterium]
MNEAYIYDSIRTPRGRGKKSGSLYEVKPIDLLATLFRALHERNGFFDTSLVDDVVLGCVTPIGEQGGDIAKFAPAMADWSERVSGMQINRFCSSGLEAINLAAMKIRSGWEQLVVAGGVESMSRNPMGSDGGAWYLDPQVNAKLGFIPQGVSADLIATLEGFTREDVDTYALQSHRRAAHARKNGYFSKSLVPVRDQNGLMILDHDETIREDASMDALAKLEPSFAMVGELGFDAVAMLKYYTLEAIHHVHTPGNSSGIVDGAALTLVGSKQIGEKLGLKPRARIVAAAVTSAEPTIMLTGPAHAARKALQLAGMNKNDIDLYEMNEAFASAVLKFQRDMDIDPNILNVNGGAIAMGHPLGATGSMLLGTVLDELERTGKATGLITLCVGGGMGVATIIERV